MALERGGDAPPGDHRRRAEDEPQTFRTEVAQVRPEPADRRTQGRGARDPHLLDPPRPVDAVVTSATLKLHAQPLARALAIVSFADLFEAIDTVAAIVATRPTAVELIDHVAKRFDKHLATRSAETAP